MDSGHVSVGNVSEMSRRVSRHSGINECPERFSLCRRFSLVDVHVSRMERRRQNEILLCRKTACEDGWGAVGERGSIERVLAASISWLER